MKTAFAFLLLAVAIFASGCNTAPKTTEAASTKLNVTTETGKLISLELPKNLDAENVVLSIPTEHGDAKFTATKLRSDASGVIQSAGAVQAETIGKLADTSTAFATLALRALTPTAAPPVPTPAPAPPAPEAEPND